MTSTQPPSHPGSNQADASHAWASCLVFRGVLCALAAPYGLKNDNVYFTKMAYLPTYLAQQNAPEGTLKERNVGIPPSSACSLDRWLHICWAAGGTVLCRSVLVRALMHLHIGIGFHVVGNVRSRGCSTCR